MLLMLVTSFCENVNVAIILSERSPFLELSSIQISEINVRSTMGNLIFKCSQTSLLIDQRCRLSIISKCVSIPCLFVDVDRRYLWHQPTLAHTRVLSLCLSGCLLSPLFFPFDIKNPFPDCLIIIEIQDFAVFGCSHFIGSNNTKILSILTHILIERNGVKSQLPCWGRGTIFIVNKT
jgi:hypothetical protein